MNIYFEEIDDDKRKRVLVLDDELMGRWPVSAFKKSEEKAAMLAFLRGLELGARKAHAEMNKIGHEVNSEFSRNFFNEVAQDEAE